MTRRRKVTINYDLDVKGVWGEFNVGAQGHSSRVFYIQTLMRPGQAGAGTEENLSTKLQTFREAFKDKRKLTFDDLMQRDLDDHRVASELIPYLMGDRGAVAHRFFPPILVCLIPILGEEMEDHYLPLDSGPQEGEPADDDDYMRVVFEYADMESQVGGFAFTRERRKSGSKAWDHYAGASLRVNTNRTKLVIIDGQHRAMAMLALHRNLNSWDKDSIEYRVFYQGIPVDKEACDSLQLPVCICFFPDLHRAASSAQKVKDACRELFLVVNSRAKAVTPSRNILLNDYNLSALFTRSVLSRLKEAGALHTSNIVIDLPSERTRVSNPLDVTSVMHVHNAVEQLLFCPDSDVNSSRALQLPNKGSHDRRMARELELKKYLGGNTDDYKKESYPRGERERIVERFNLTWGQAFTDFFARFRLYKVSRDAAEWLETEKEAVDNEAAATATKLLFGGQGRRYVYDEAYAHTRKEISELLDRSGSETDERLNQLKSKRDSFRNVKKVLNNFEEDFEFERTVRLFDLNPVAFKDALAQGHEDAKRISILANDLFGQVATSAFQTGVLMAVARLKRSLESEHNWDFSTSDSADGSPSELSKLVGLLTSALNRLFDFRSGTPDGKWNAVYRAEILESRGGRLSRKLYPNGLLGSLVPDSGLDPRRWPVFTLFSLMHLEVYLKEEPSPPGTESDSEKAALIAAVEQLNNEFRQLVVSDLLDSELKHLERNYSEQDWKTARAEVEKGATAEVLARVERLYGETF